MSNDEQLTVLTQLAFVNALILSFLSIQFVIPFTFLLLFWLLPALFAFQFCYAPLRFAWLANVLAIGLSFLLFGVEVGLWAFVYGGIGSILGLGRKLRLPFILRFPIGLVSTICLLAVVIWLLVKVAGLDWDEIRHQILSILQFTSFSFVFILVIGLLGWGVLLTTAAEYLLSRIINHLPIELTV